MSWQQASVFAIATALAAGCAEHLHSIERSDTWSTGILFWPPPTATSVWLAEPSASATLGDASGFIGEALRKAGYVDQRWFPIGAHYEHGFAVTTRLERIDEDGTPKSLVERWLPQYPEAASLRWLTGSAETYLPRPGRYRVLLVAFTDLHVPLQGGPQRWDQGTAMEGPSLPSTELPARRRVRAGHRVGVGGYGIRWSRGQGTNAVMVLVPVCGRRITIGIAAAGGGPAVWEDAQRIAKRLRFDDASPACKFVTQDAQFVSGT